MASGPIGYAPGRDPPGFWIYPQRDPTAEATGNAAQRGSTKRSSATPPPSPPPTTGGKAGAGGTMATYTVVLLLGSVGVSCSPWMFPALRGVCVCVRVDECGAPSAAALVLWCGGVVFSRCRAVLVKALLFPELCCVGPVPSSCLSCFPRSTSCVCVCRRACFVLPIPPRLCSAPPPIALSPIRPQSQWRALFHAPSLLEVPVERVIPARAHGSSRPHPTGGCE